MIETLRGLIPRADSQPPAPQVRHYVKIPPTLKTWFPGGAPTDWREIIFADATAQGTELVLQLLPPNPGGVRAAVFGDRFYYEVGRDHDRQDTLFLMRIERADRRLPRAVPRTVKRTLLLWPGGDPLQLDKVHDLFGAAAATVVERAPVASTVPDQPSPLLLSLLSRVRTDIRAGFRPTAGVGEPEGAADFVVLLRRVWSRFRLDRYAELSTRQEALLKGLVTPHALDRRERDELTGVFGIRLLNNGALDLTNNPARPDELFEALATMPLNTLVQATLWAGMLTGLDLQHLRRELYESAKGLKVLAGGDQAVATTWQESLVPLLLETARSNQDAGLVDLLESAGRGAAFLGELADWASRLQFDEPTAPVVDAPVLDAAAPIPDIAAPAPAGSATPPTHGLSTVEKWVVRLRLQDADDLILRRSTLTQVAASISALPTALETLDAVRALVAVAKGIEASLGTVLKGLPDPSQLEEDFVEARDAYARAADLLGDRADELLALGVTPRDLNEIVRLLKRPEVLAGAPAWLWLVDDPEVSEDLPRGDMFEAARRLVRPATRSRIQGVCDMVDQLDEVSALGWIPQLPQGADPGDHLRIWFEETREFLLTVPDEVRPWLKAGIASREDVRGLSLLREVLDAGSFERVEGRARDLEDPAQRGREIALFCKAIEFYRRNFIDPRLVPYDSLQAWVDNERRSAVAVGEGLAPSASDVLVEHNWTEQSGARATLVFSRPDPAVDYGFVSAPLVLETDAPRTLEVRVDWQVKGDLRAGWPPEWPNSEPEQIVVPLYRWREQPDSGKHHHAFEARFPIRLPRGDRVRLEVNATLLDIATGKALGSPKTLRWENIALEYAPPAIQWGDATVPEYVTTHPIGPQQRADSILMRLASGGSFAVIAPRRFGKSTLVEYLVAAGKPAGLAIPQAAVCTDSRYTAAGAFDYERLWADVSDRLHQLLGTGLPREMAGPLPDEGAFDHVRRAAKTQGYKAVVLLFDEAQLLFPPARGGELGAELKRLLERHWARSDSDRVPLVVGMVGLPSFQERAGGDLTGLLNPIARDVMSEEELRPLIRQVTTRLVTTRGARTRLAQTAGNLLILRAMLERLASHVSAEFRWWANHDDVVGIEEGLRRDLEAGKEETVAAFVRDVLNAGERVHIWEPINAFPLAVALAKTRVHGQSLDEARERATDLLNQWCLQYQTTPSSVPTYDRPLVDELMGQLRERRVITDTGFGSEFLAAWLTGISQRGAFDEPFRNALIRGAHRRIQIPPAAEPIGAGAEATIYRDRKSALAYRVRLLASAVDELRFRETVSIFDALKAVVQRREVGSDHVFELIDIGLSAKNPREAVQVYRWIEGEDLTHYKEAASADLVIEMGVKLGRGLRLLHRYNILHRDICPRNIVLDRESDPESIRPVLIDFGFARLATMPMNTALAGDHVAPEARDSKPLWGRGADIYSLGWTLGWLLKKSKSDASVLGSLLTSTQAARAEERPTADDFVAAFERFELDAHLKEKRDQSWREIEQSTGEDRHSPWFAPVLRSSRSLLVPMRMGFHADRVDQFAALAYFLNRVSEGEPIRKCPLKDIHVTVAAGDLDISKVLWALRNYHAHGHASLFHETKALVETFRHLPQARQMALFKDGISVVEKECRLKRLSSLMNLLLPAS